MVKDRKGKVELYGLSHGELVVDHPQAVFLLAIEFLPMPLYM